MDKHLNSFILLTLLFLFGYLFVNSCACNLGFKENMCNGKEHFTVKETSRKNFNF